MADIPPVRLRNASEPMGVGFVGETSSGCSKSAVFTPSRVSTACLFKFSPPPRAFIVKGGDRKYCA